MSEHVLPPVDHDAPDHDRAYCMTCDNRAPRPTNSVTLDVGTSDMYSVEAVVKALGAKIVDRQITPGAVGYTTITIEKEGS